MDLKQIDVLRDILTDTRQKLQNLEQQKRDIENVIQFLESMGPEIEVRVVYKEESVSYSNNQLELMRPFETVGEIFYLKKLHDKVEQKIIAAEASASEIAREAVHATEWFDEPTNKVVDFTQNLGDCDEKI